MWEKQKVFLKIKHQLINVGEMMEVEITIKSLSQWQLTQTGGGGLLRPEYSVLSE